METPDALGIIAGSGAYPLLVAQAARASGVREIVAIGFTGETDPKLEGLVDQMEWMRVGQLGRLLSYLRTANVRRAMMAGQIAPKNLFALRPDWKALLLLAGLQRRNAETIFGAIADELSHVGIKLLPAFTFLEEYLAPAGLIAGPALTRRQEADVTFGLAIAKEITRLDVGQTVIVKNGTVLAVEAFEGTDEAVKRGGNLGGKGAVMVKVSKANQDMRFDVPVIGVQTVLIAAAANIRVIAVEAGRTLLLEKDGVIANAERCRVSIFGS